MDFRRFSFFLLLLPGCTTLNYSPHAPVSRVRTMSLCAAYGMGVPAARAAEVRNELVLRSAVNAEEWENVDARRIAPGMRECSVQSIVAVAGVAHYVGREEKGKLIGRDVYYRCGDVGSNLCPFMLITYDQGGLVQSVSSVAKLPTEK